MPDLNSQAQPEVSALIAKAELIDKADEYLYHQLGLRLYAIQEDVALSASFSPKINEQIESQGAAEDLTKFGTIFFERVNIQAFQLICGSQAQDSNQRQKVLDAFGATQDAVGAAIAGLLIAQLGLAPALAPVVAVLILRLVFRPAYETMCEVWKEKQPQTNQKTG